LSYRAAQVLDMDKKGVADVKIEVITPGKAVANTSKEQQSAADRLGLDRRWLNVQLLTTRNRAEAEKEKARLESELTHPVYIDSSPLSRDVHLRVGPVKGIDNAELLKRQMRSKGYQDAFIVK
ncbi:MAG TPA: SPOR domain-containing protein, partial [Candidatus Obscuribacterales bacterium]